MDSCQHLDVFPYLEYFENIADWDWQPTSIPLPQTETYLGAGAPISNHSTEPGERDIQGWIETNLPNDPYYQFAKYEEYKYIHCWTKKKGMKI